MKNGYKLGLSALAASIALVGCGGGSSSSGGSTVETISGKFIDAAVKGLKYVTATQEGYTDENGTYNCAPGEQVTFSIGNYLELGTTECGVLASPESIATTQQEIQNMAYLLQNLDANQSNGDTIDVSNFQDYNLTDINLSSSGFNMSVLEDRDENLSDLLDPDYVEITKEEALINMETAVGTAEKELQSELQTFLSGRTLTIAGTDIPNGMTLSFESNGRFIDYDPEDFADNINCVAYWWTNDYNEIMVGEGDCGFDMKFIGTPEDGVLVDVNVTDEVPAFQVTGTLTTVGTDLKAFVTDKDFDFDEQSAPGVDFEIYFGVNGEYVDYAVEDDDMCFGEWIAIADDTIAVPQCGVKFTFPATLEDGMTITATAQDPGQTAETFTGTLTEWTGSLPL